MIFNEIARKGMACCLVLCLGVFSAGATSELAVTEGAEPSFSPDGRRILFQRCAGREIHVGVLDLENGRTTWVWNGHGRAYYPAWAPDGSVIYSCRNETRTAFAVHRANDGEGGVNLYLWKDGGRRRLTVGRHIDLTPAVSADGTTVYFASTEPYDMKNPLYRNHPYKEGAVVMSCALDGSSKPIAVTSVTPPMFGLASPRPSPDGRKLAIARLDGYFSSWRIVTSSVLTPDDVVYETPPEMVAYAPAWRPDGRALAFTGYRVGDPGWGVYVKDLETGALTRIAAGENPSWRKDGRMLVYERDGTVYLKGVP